MPRILLDLRMVRGQLHGIARYALELARRLPGLAPDLHFEALIPRDGLPPGLGPLEPDLPLRPVNAGFLRPLEQPALGLALSRLQPDLFHATSFSLPALWPGPLVATLHDANHLALPQHYGRTQRAYYRLVVRPRAQTARALITVSEFSRAELGLHLELDPHRLQVIPNGVDERFRPRPASELKALRARFGLPDRFFLVVGNQKPHKGLGLLARVAKDLPAPLALVAEAGAARSLGFPSDTLDLGPVGEADLPGLYAAAVGLLFPSTYEGFGLPALEAMACGCPVVAVNASALPEVCGEAALLVEPANGAALVEAASRLWRDERLRQTLRERGQVRAARFSWDGCARQTLAVYRRVLDRAR